VLRAIRLELRARVEYSDSTMLAKLLRVEAETTYRGQLRIYYQGMRDGGIEALALYPIMLMDGQRFESDPC
jgi:Ran GTPase-activating protein (RanGAP) involved in mRNA processing and transport